MITPGEATSSHVITTYCLFIALGQKFQGIDYFLGSNVPAYRYLGLALGGRGGGKEGWGGGVGGKYLVLIFEAFATFNDDGYLST